MIEVLQGIAASILFVVIVLWSSLALHALWSWFGGDD